MAASEFVLQKVRKSTSGRPVALQSAVCSSPSLTLGAYSCAHRCLHGSTFFPCVCSLAVALSFRLPLFECSRCCCCCFCRCCCNKCATRANPVTQGQTLGRLRTTLVRKSLSRWIDQAHTEKAKGSRNKKRNFTFLDTFKEHNQPKGTHMCVWISIDTYIYACIYSQVNFHAKLCLSFIFFSYTSSALMKHPS